MVVLDNIIIPVDILIDAEYPFIAAVHVAEVTATVDRILIQRATEHVAIAAIGMEVRWGQTRFASAHAAGGKVARLHFAFACARTTIAVVVFVCGTFTGHVVTMKVVVELTEVVSSLASFALVAVLTLTCAQKSIRTGHNLFMKLK